MRQDFEMNDWVYWILQWGLILMLGILFIRAATLSIIKHSYYRALARDNKMYETKIPAPRGQILDRKGRLLAKSVYQYYKLENGNKVYQGDGDFQGYRFEGKDLAYDIKREYEYGKSLGLVTGYIGRITENQLNNYKCGQTSKDASIGKSGIEEYFDCQLRGKDGKRLIEVDAKGRYVRELGREEPKSGENLQLSIDAYWQDKIYKLLDGRKAVVVISEPKTGKIIAMVSSPSYDPNDFSYNKDDIAINSYLNDNENLPLLNRTISGRYHPGSVFKIAVAAGGLESGAIDGDTLIEDTGVVKVGDYSYNNWLFTKKGGTEGMVNVVKALQRSNDIFFYKLGEKMGVDTMKEWAEKFGYGARTGVELLGELEGIVPDDKWKQETKGERWFLGNTYHFSIGQGDVSVTPLQVNLSTNIIANEGKKCNLSIIKDSKVECKDVGIKNSTLNLVKAGMEAACKTGGTAWPLFEFKTKIACKTGTAEVGDGSKDTHAWLTAYAPMENPEISITVLVERGGEGSDEAAPIVGDILKEWFGETNTRVPRYDENHKVVYQ